MTDELAAQARALIEANRYLTLSTVGPDGRPWTTPVYFTAAGLREFYWASAADAVHSRHLAERPQVSWVVFDSTVAPYHGRALYAAGERGSCPAPTSTAGWPPIRAATGTGRPRSTGTT